MNRFRTFASDRRGTVTQFLTIAMLPLMGITGLAVDYARSTQAKSEIQGALDSTALMLTREAPKKDVAALKKLADPYFAALIASKRPEYAFSGIAVQKTDKIVSVSTNAAVKTFFGGIYAWFGASNANSWTVDVASTAAYGTKKIELALVLDNTGSMASANKIVELKKASHTLLTMLQSAATAPDQVKVAVVPYTTQVRLDTTYKNANWLTTTPTGTFIGGAGYTVPASRDFWNGCIADRDTGYNADTKPVSIPVAKSLYPMVNCVGGGIARMMPLSSNFVA
ncbi:MAG TPA: pilus assembly protein, partial [Rhabdaerophilum sp.]|nr:pilus assembly protein [Rhabdaerophilum sp.]